MSRRERAAAGLRDLAEVALWFGAVVLLSLLAGCSTPGPRPLLWDCPRGELCRPSHQAPP